MGKTSFSGPAFGAYTLLWSGTSDGLGNSTTANTMNSIVVPSYVDWYVTSLHVHRGSTHSTAFVGSLVDDSTTIATVALTSSLANVAGSTSPTKTPGEFIGLQVLGGSSLVFTVHNGGSSVASTGVVFHVYGFARYLENSSLVLSE